MSCSSGLCATLTGAEPIPVTGNGRTSKRGADVHEYQLRGLLFGEVETELDRLEC